MNIDKSKLDVGLWYTDETGKKIGCPDGEVPKNAAYAHTFFPLELRENIYKIHEGRWGEKNKVLSSGTNLCRASGRLAVAMVNSGDYDLYEALAVLRRACERCTNVLWHKYLPDEDGYEEYSEEWYKANTICDFCKENIRVGDEVVFENGSTKFVVTSIRDNMLNGIGRDGSAFVDKYESKWRKTGRHFKTAELLMKEIEEGKCVYESVRETNDGTRID